MTQEKREFEDWLSCARQAKRVALLAHISPDGVEKNPTAYGRNKIVINTTE